MAGSWIIVWLMLGVAALGTAGIPPRPFPALLAAIPWLTLLPLLAIQRRREALIGSWGNAGRGARASVLILAAAALLLWFMFGIRAAVLVGLWGLAAIALCAALASPRRFEGQVTGAATATVTILILALAGEAVLRIPSVDARLGARRTDEWVSRYDRLWERNAFDFRSRHQTIERAEGARRIVVLGDSFTWGDKIERTEDTWPSVLEAELSATSRTEVINMAQRGLSTVGEARQLRETGWQFSPDLLIVQYYLNDVASPPVSDYLEEKCPTRTIIPRSWWTSRASSSALLYFVNRRYHQIRNGPGCLITTVPGKGGIFDDLYEPDSRAWTLMGEALAEIADSAEIRGVPVLMVQFPIYLPGEWTADTYPYDAWHRQVADEARRHGIAVLDLTPLYADGRDWEGWWATPYDNHPSVEAHAVAARAVAEYLRAADEWANPPVQDSSG